MKVEEPKGIGGITFDLKELVPQVGDDSAEEELRAIWSPQDEGDERSTSEMNSTICDK